MTLQPGTRLGPYEISAQIGVGGMGEVYQATDTNLKRQVAIKVLPEAVASDAERLARFQREAEVLAALNHPNIAAIYGLERTDGQTALVMELVEGPTLADRIALGAIPVDEALPIARQIAEALEAAHEQGIIHRDLKPANVKVRPDGTVKVLDFGLAKAMEPTGVMSPGMSQLPTITTPAMTQAGMILGTAAYMSPEQARGKSVDKRADVWAFGCVLYEMLTGRRAFEAEDVSLTLARVLERDPDWSVLPSGVSPSVALYLRRSLHKNPKQRIPDVQDVRLALEGAFEMPASGSGGAMTATAVPPVWRRVAPLATAVLVSGVIVGVGVRMMTPSEPRPVVRSAHRLPDGRAFFNLGRSVVAISRDGRQLAYNGSMGIYVRTLEELDDRLITDLDSLLAASPVFSPDGQSLAFFSQNFDDLRRVTIGGGTPLSLAVTGESFGLSWENDGAIVYGQRDGIWQISENGGEPRRIVTTAENEVPFGPRRLPGGDWVLMTVAQNLGGVSRWDEAQIVAVSTGSGERRVLRSGGSDARYVPTGHLVYAQGAVLYAMAFDVDRLEATGAPVAVVQGVRRASNPGGATGSANYAVSDNGTLVYVPGPISGTAQSTLAWVDETGRRSIINMPPGQYEHPRVSPDGRWLVVERLDQVVDLWLYEVSGTSAERRLTEGGNNRYPVWSRDSQYLVFQSDREGDRGIFRQRADGTGAVERLTTPEDGVEHIPEDWSPAADRLVASVVSQEGAELWTWSFPEGSAERVGTLLSTAPFDATYSPDGAWIAYTERLGAVATYLQPVSGDNRYQIGRDDDLAHHPLWLPDGNRLVYFPGGNASAVVVEVRTEPTVSFGRPEPIAGGLPLNVTPASLLNHDVGPDGRFVTVLAGTDAEGSQLADQVVIVQNWTEELERLVPTD